MNSKHIAQADGFGHAVDLYPYPIDMKHVNGGYWPEIIRFGVLAGIIKTLAPKHGLMIRWGMDWDSDGRTLDHSFFDAPHFEIERIL
jgi:peptidoglycan LD-endopeptidase CwlK